MVQTGKIFLPSGFGIEFDRSNMSAVLNIEPKLNSCRQLADPPHYFDRECVGLDFLLSLFNRVAQIGAMFFQRVPQFVYEEKHNRVSKIPICALRNRTFLASIIGNTERAENRGKRSTRRGRRFAKK